MKAYSISYDLNKVGKDYDGLINAIKSYGTYCACTESYWLIMTNHTAEQIYQKLKPHLDNDDYVFIVDIGNDYTGWLPKRQREWINRYLTALVYS